MSQCTLWGPFYSSFQISSSKLLFVNICFSSLILSFSFSGLYNRQNLICILFPKNPIFLSQRLLPQPFHCNLSHLISHIGLVFWAPDIAFTLNKPHVLKVLILGMREREEKNHLMVAESWLKEAITISVSQKTKIVLYRIKCNGT